MSITNLRFYKELFFHGGVDENLSLTCSRVRDGERKEENGKETLEIFLYSSTPEFFRRKEKITRKKDSKISSQK